MNNITLENIVGLTSNVDYKLNIKEQQEILKENDFSNGTFINTENKNNSIVLKVVNDGHEKGINDFNVSTINLANKAESGWEFKVQNQNLVINKLGFYNSSEYNETRTVTLWDSLTKTKIISTVVSAKGLSWGVTNIVSTTLQIDKNYVISIGSYGNSIYSSNIASDINFNANKISFISARYIDKQLGVFPIKTSNKFYALPDVFFDTEIEYAKNGEYISSWIDLSKIDVLNNFKIDWLEHIPESTSVKIQITFDDINWIDIIKNTKTITSNFNYCKFKIILNSEGKDTPIIENLTLTFNGYTNINQETLTKCIPFKTFIKSNEIISNYKVENVFLNSTVNSEIIQKKNFDKTIQIPTLIKESNIAVINSSIDFDVFVEEKYINILSKPVLFDTKIKNIVSWVNSENINFNLTSIGELLYSKHVLWDEKSKDDFSKGTLYHTIVTDRGLELEHWNTKTISEDFSDDTLNFNFIGDWERIYWGKDLENTDRGFIYRSKEIKDSQTSSTYFEFNTPVNSVDVTISFNYFVSSEKTKDLLTILVDSQPIVISGDLGWQQYSANIESGYHRVEFIYRKNKKIEYLSNEYLDRACIDEFNVSYAFLRPEGYRISPSIDLSEIKIFQTSKITWESEIFEEDSTVEINASLDNGLTWFPLENGGSLPFFNPGDDLTDKNLLLKESLYCAFNKSPTIKNISIDILGFTNYSI